MTDNTKAVVRKQASLRRAQAHDPTGRAAQAACLHVTRVLRDQFGATVTQCALAAYMAIGEELDPLDAMLAHDGTVCVPVVQSSGHALAFHRWTWDTPMVNGAFNVRVPAVVNVVTPDVLLVPLLAFDARGFRLGYGGGFYDRTLAALRAQGSVLAIGLCYDSQEVPEVPVEPTDEPLDMVITPSGLRVF